MKKRLHPDQRVMINQIYDKLDTNYRVHYIGIPSKSCMTAIQDSTIWTRSNNTPFMTTYAYSEFMNIISEILQFNEYDEMNSFMLNVIRKFRCLALHEIDQPAEKYHILRF